jgi:hypothetical protein
MAKDLIFKGKLVAKSTDLFGYTSLVFENLSTKDSDLQYIFSTMFPRWNQSYMEVGDIGFVNVKYVEAGIDSWFDGTDFVKYKYSGVHFIKFIKEKPEPEVEIDLSNSANYLEISLHEEE